MRIFDDDLAYQEDAAPFSRKKHSRRVMTWPQRQPDSYLDISSKQLDTLSPQYIIATPELLRKFLIEAPPQTFEIAEGHQCLQGSSRHHLTQSKDKICHGPSLSSHPSCQGNLISSSQKASAGASHCKLTQQSDGFGDLHSLPDIEYLQRSQPVLERHSYYWS